MCSATLWVLQRLKELEALLKLVETLGRIERHTGAGGGGLDAPLMGSLKRAPDA